LRNSIEYYKKEEQMAVKAQLLIIDPQIDFCDPKGALFVKGADDDMKRAAKMVTRISDKLDDIHVTLDTHRYVDIAHPIYWKDSKGVHPNPFTIISAKDVSDGVWTPSIPSLYKRGLEYVKTLEKNGRYPLCIWPPHCLLGSWGHNVVPVLWDALTEWEKGLAQVDYVTKGSNPHTEHYSIFQADVPDPQDPSTQLNTRLVQTIMDADIIGVLGEASSHCLANSVTDLANAFGDDKFIQKLVLITDATSPVTGFENLQDDFIKKMTARGMQTATTSDFLA
jgi:nicotinamidase/pyrazinamidase